MKDNNSFKNNSQLLSGIERKVFNKACNVLIKAGWDPIIENDADWKWVLLATHQYPGREVVLRRIKPVSLNSLSDFDKALKSQARLRSQLVEISPYKVFLGNKISLSRLDKPFYFLSEADIKNWTKFFKSKNFSLKTNLIDEAKNMEGD